MNVPTWLYLTESKAKHCGFTHHGKYYGLPIWIGEDGPGVMVAPKCGLLEPVMTLFHYIEAAANYLLGNEQLFMFLKGDPIAGD